MIFILVTFEALRTYSPYAPEQIAHPVMQQSWRDLTFLHWPYEADVIGKLLPAQLSIDTFDGKAWIGLAPFVLAGVRPFGLPAAPWISQFPETNVRTYVLGPDGKPGVWFFTLEADRLLAVLAARAWYKLPYRWAKMSVESDTRVVQYRSQRKALFGRGSTDIAIEVGEQVAMGDLDNFLTARFRLYAAYGARLGYSDIEHEPWIFQQGRVVRLEEDLMVNSSVPAWSGEPLVHFSRRLEVRVGPLRWYTN